MWRPGKNRAFTWPRRMLEAKKPSATRNLFEKRFLDFQKLLINPKTEGFWQKLDPRTKMLCVFSLLAAVVATPIHHYRKFLAYSLIILLLAIISRVRVKHYLIRLVFLVPLLVFLSVSLWVFSQEQRSHQTWILFNLYTKTFLTFCSVGILVLTVKFEHITRSMEVMRVPGIFTSILHFAHRYVVLFQQEAGRMITARKARSFGRRKTWRERKTAAAVIPLFLFRVLDRSERIYVAMLSRGYREVLPTFHSHSYELRLRGQDYLFGIAFLLVLVVVLALL